MVERIRGIVLDSFKFKETSLVFSVYTSDHGLLSFISSGLGKKKNGLSQVYFQPLSLIEINANLKERRGLIRASNPSLIESPIGILPDVRRYAVAAFIAEVVLKTCKEKEMDDRLYVLLNEVVANFCGDGQIQDIHLYFLIVYAEVLGFSFKAIDQTGHSYWMGLFDEETRIILNSLLAMDKYAPLQISKQNRSKLLKLAVHYLEQHIEMPRIKSLEILEEVFAS